MNVRTEVRDALLVRKMWYRRIRTNPLSAANCPKWKARKNYLFLVRKYLALAERHGLHETNVF